jgi:hypothetical protein
MAFSSIGGTELGGEDKNTTGSMSEEGGSVRGWSASIPEVQGCLAQGDRVDLIDSRGKGLNMTEDQLGPVLSLIVGKPIGDEPINDFEEPIWAETGWRWMRVRRTRLTLRIWVQLDK